MVVPDGTGEQAVADYADRTSRFFNARQAVMAAQKRVDPVSLSELLGIVDIWVEAALRLGDSDLRRIERFIGSQERRRAAAQHAFPAAPAALAGLPLQ
jgi:DSF synthase